MDRDGTSVGGVANLIHTDAQLCMGNRESSGDSGILGDFTRKWWYTHPRTRRAHRRLERLAKQGTLFAYLTGPAGEPRHTPLERTTNPVEAINAQVRATLRHHRGAGPDHQAAIIDWTLARLTEQPPTPTQALKAWNQDGRRPAARLPTRKTRTSARPHPAGWGTTPTPEEGLWTRKGWAGRTH